jgi:hypothetical protein
MANNELMEAIENVLDARFQFGMTPQILEMRAKRLAQVAQKQLYEAILTTVENIPADLQCAYRGRSESHIPLYRIADAIAQHDPRKEEKDDPLID